MSAWLRSRVALWSVTGIYLLALFVATSLPARDVPLPNVPSSDKTAHLVAYFGLGALLCLSLRAERLSRARGAAFALAIACTYAILDELHQTWIPTRSASVGDAVADWIGAILGVAAASTLGPLEDDPDQAADSADQ